MNQRYTTLIKNLKTYKIYLKENKIDLLMKDIFDKTYKFMQSKRKQDILSIHPYDSSVSNKFNCTYLNASFINLPGLNFIACQMPKSEYIKEFENFLIKAKIKVILSLNSENLQLFNHNPIIRNEIMFNEKPFLYDELYIIDSIKIRRIYCLVWKDHSTMTVEQMDMLYNYMEKVYQECNIKFKNYINKESIIKYIDSFIDKNDNINILTNNIKNNFINYDYIVVHCFAGVGRTGTYIFYKLLKNIQKVNNLEFLKIFLFLRSSRFLFVETVDQLNFLINCFLKN